MVCLTELVRQKKINLNYISGLCTSRLGNRLRALTLWGRKKVAVPASPAPVPGEPVGGLGDAAEERDARDQGGNACKDARYEISDRYT